MSAIAHYECCSRNGDDFVQADCGLSLSLSHPTSWHVSMLHSVMIVQCISEIVTILPLHKHGLRPHSMIQNSHKKFSIFFLQPPAICAARPWLFVTQSGPSNSRMGSTRREPSLSPKPWCMTTYRQRGRERDWRKINAHLMCKLMHLMLIRNGRKNFVLPRANYLGALCPSDRSESNFSKLEDWERERERERERPGSSSSSSLWHVLPYGTVPCALHIQEGLLHLCWWRNGVSTWGFNRVSTNARLTRVKTRWRK